MSLVHGTGVDGASATGVNPVLIGGKDAAGNIDTLKVESGVASFSDAALAALIGEKQASPTANTLLARIKALETALAGTLTMQLSGSKVVDAVIAQNETESTEIDFRNYKYMAIQMPDAWDAATLTIKGSATAGGTKVDIVNDAGVAFPAMTVAASKIYSIDLHALKIAAIPYLALVSSADQTANRTIKVMLEQ